jgi:arylformamidase
MRVFDVSMAIHGDMAVYKNLEGKRPVIYRTRKMPEDGVNESVITMNVHTGTHIDAPGHVLEDGADVESIDPERLMGPCRVCDLTPVENGIGTRELEDLGIKEGDFVLLKTKNSFTEAFLGDFAFLDKSGAQYLADRNIRGVGIDSLGIERGQPGHETHKILMSRGIIIIEGLRLKDVDPGEYLMCALHIKIRGADGAPARVVLMKA